MTQNKNKSFSLLSQEEIDTLVKFLTDKKNTVGSDVLSQASIDKLIQLIKTDKGRLALDMPFVSGSLEATLLNKLRFRSKAEEICELRCSVNAESNFIELSIYNTATNQTLSLTPKMFDAEDTEDWGYAITPYYFNHIAQSLSLKYTQATHDFVCSTFAKTNFGSADHKIPEMYLPDNAALVESLL